MVNLNILSQRYASLEMNAIFSELNKNIYERNLWIAVMKAQKKLGLNIPSEDIEKFEAAKTDVNLARIREIEQKTNHDIKAKIQTFIETAGAGEYLHMGMTSRDLTDNVEQMQIRDASKLVFSKYISVLRHFGEKANEYEDIILTARTHHQAAQMTLLGRRFSMWQEELLQHLPDLENFIKNYPLRGIKGPVGTMSDMATLLNDYQKAQQLETSVSLQLGFGIVLDSPGQVYPRSLDYSLVSKLASLSAAPENFAISMRLMAGYELVTEGFKEGQVGSTAMPHKMNTPHSERICGLAELVKMYSDGISRISGNQWEEGDVSCSVGRRVIIPDSFYASDGLCETTLNVLNDMGTYPQVISAEVDKYLPFLATTEILQLAVKSGMGREMAHSIIKKYAIDEALRMRRGEKPNLVAMLSMTREFKDAGITDLELNDLMSKRDNFVGMACDQINDVANKASHWTSKYQESASYEPRPIL